MAENEQVREHPLVWAMSLKSLVSLCSPVAKTACSQCRGPGFEPCAATKTLCSQINKHFLKNMESLARFKNSRMSSLWKGSIGIMAEWMRYLAALTGVLPS